jgi:hypothetical protein
MIGLQLGLLLYICVQVAPDVSNSRDAFICNGQYRWSHYGHSQRLEGSTRRQTPFCDNLICSQAMKDLLLIATVATQDASCGTCTVLTVTIAGCRPSVGHSLPEICHCSDGVDMEQLFK